MIMAKNSNNNYVNIEDIEAKNNNEYQDIEKIVSKQGNLLYNKYKEIEDTLPINFKGKGKDLTNYRIYGNTVGGESVGDRTGNLFDKSATSTINGYKDGAYINQLGGEISESIYAISEYILIPEGANMISMNVPVILLSPSICFYGNDKTYISGANYNRRSVVTESIPIGAKYLRFTVVKRHADTIMLNSGSTPLPYEPYGYRVPVTVEGKNLFDGNVKNGNYQNDAYYPRVKWMSPMPIAFGDTITINSDPDVINVAFIVVDNDGHNQILNGQNLSSSNVLLDTGWQTVPFVYISEYTGYLALLFKSADTSSVTLTTDTMPNVMLNSGSTPLPYEPYHFPVTTPIYLPEQIKMVGDEAEYIDYEEQKFVKKFYELTWNFDDMNNNETYPGWSGGTALVEYCNKIRSLATNPNSYIPIQYSSISNFTAFFNVSSNNSILYLGNSSVIGHTQSELKEIYAGQSITFILKISDTDLDVTLPALPTVTGTNVLTVGTVVQPSKVYLKGKLKRTIYGWHVDPDISDSSNAVTYLKDAIGMTPASMGSPTFNYGSWQNAFFMPKPCMLKSNGKVDYYLDPNDYTKKSDGTASDISNPNYDGNAMMQWPKIWFKYVKGVKEGQGYFYVANYKADGNYHCWCNYDSEDNEIDHFYTAIYNGTSFMNYSASKTYVINDFAIYNNKLYKCNTAITTAQAFDSAKWNVVSNTAPAINKMRSLSGIRLTNNNGNAQTNTITEVTRAEANNTTVAKEWYIETFSDRLLINGLLVLMGKSLNTQAIFGRGLDSGSQSAKEAYITGALNDKGLFYGVTGNGNSAVKVFGMENFWGCEWHRIAGLITNNHAIKLKLTYGTKDGSTVVGYNQTGNGYIDNGISPYANGYVQKMSYNKYGFIPAVITGGSQSTYYADYHYQNATYTGIIYALFGGNSGSGLAAGAFYLVLHSTPENAHWSIAASLSCKPLL